MMMIRSLVIVTALCLCGTSASPLTMQECRDKYKSRASHGNASGSELGWLPRKAMRY